MEPSTNLSTISVTYGCVTGKVTGKVAIMVAKPTESDSHVDLDIVLPSTTLKPGKYPRKSPAASIQGRQLATYGEWSNTTYSDIPDDTLLVVQVSTTRGKASYADGAIICRVRHTGPLNDVRVHLFNSVLLGFDGHYINVDNFTNNSGAYEISAISGRFDVLKLEDLEDAFRGKEVRMKEYYINKYFSEEEVNELFHVMEIAPELSTVRTAISSSGERVQISRRTVNRQIKLLGVKK